MTDSTLPKAADLIALAERAGAAILEIYNTDFEVIEKADESPLTKADLASHEVLVEGLQALTPDIPILSEESAPPEFDVRRNWTRYWLLDPLDGTKEFVNRNGEFTVNIALIEGNRSVIGVVGVPVQDRVFYGDVKAGQTRLVKGGVEAILRGRVASERVASGEGVTAVASRSHGGERLETYLDSVADSFGGLDRKPMGSSLKLCTLAEGEADIYPRLGPTSEWDIAAADAVLTAAGGAVYTFDGQRLQYNAKESLLNPEFLAVGDASFDWIQKLPALPAAA
ncbi:MAG: 3'(2'),5'-bisphosphate nucleotidase CysQ [Pseudomonadota bacterium]